MIARILLLALLALTFARRADAQTALDVGRGLRSQTPSDLALYEDTTAALPFEQIATPAFAARFAQTGQQALSRGYTNSVYWLRFGVANSAAVERSWLLELAYPHLDYVTLYVPRADGGYDVHETGDMLPFATRDFDYRNFIFPLTERPGGTRVYYLRVATSGAMTLPLTAWTMREFFAHQHQDWAMLCVFYGVLLAMTLYNACLWLFTRQGEYARYALMALSTALFQFAFVGHSYQYFVPDEPLLAQRLVPISLAFCLTCNFFWGEKLALIAGMPAPYLRLLRWLLGYCVLLTVLGAFLPGRIILPLLATSTVILNIIPYTYAIRMWQSDIVQGKALFLAQLCVGTGAVVFSLCSAGVLPANFFTLWSVQISCSIQYVLISAALAGKLNIMRDEHDALNRALRHQVGALEGALQATEQAGRTIEQMTVVKDEFMATMSHELRTPLNAIINIPQGLIEQLPLERHVTCKACSARFALEAGELLAPGTPCPDCGGTAFEESEHVHYTGQPERTALYLRKIERAGLHLLQVVNGILDASQIAAGHLTLRRKQTSVVELSRDVLEQMSDLAERAGVALTFVDEAGDQKLHVDPLRLRQVLINLLGNAIKFSRGRGAVTLRVATVEGGCQFSVRDEGIGIAPGDLDKVFGSFQQVHGGNAREYGGTGLGLSIARSLVLLHQGEMWVDSELGRGACFTFRIPTHVSESDAPPLANAS